jgi:hypothetical protein
VPPSRCVLDFDPRRDGFAFDNAFRWEDDDLAFLAAELRPLLRGLTLGLPALAGGVLGGRRGLLAGAGAGAVALAGGLPEALLGRLARRRPSFGLCGGMALAAAERWPHGVALPTAQLRPDAARALLRRRQARTIRAAGADFLRWWLRARAAGGRPLAAAGPLAREVARLRARLGTGRPVVVGLAGDAPDPFALHQVVAFGYEEEGGVTTFRVYDPNAPGRTRHVRAWTEGPLAHVTTDLPTGPKKRGGYHIHRQPGRLAMLFAIGV